VDCFDGRGARCGVSIEQGKDVHPGGEGEEDLVVIHPAVDGRLKDEGRTWPVTGTK